MDTIVDRWKRAHPRDVLLHDPRGDEFPKIRSGDILKALEELKPEERTAETITQIIGNASWVTVRCDACLETQYKVVSLGNGFFKKFYCQDCIHNAWKLF